MISRRDLALKQNRGHHGEHFLGSTAARDQQQKCGAAVMGNYWKESAAGMVQSQLVMLVEWVQWDAGIGGA